MKKGELESVSKKLTEFVDEFSDIFSWKKRSQHCCEYLSGLILDGERKSIDPIASRLENVDKQALQQFVNQSPWDGFALQDALRKSMIERFNVKSAKYVLDDTSLPKKGKHSVGVASQYCGAMGKVANCQSVVSLQGVVERYHFPLAARLYLPEVWTNDVEHMVSVGVPAEEQKFKEKWRIALDLLDRSRKDCPCEVLLFDAGYGCNRVFLKELDDRNIKFVGQLKGDETFWDIDAKLFSLDKTLKVGRPRKHVKPVDLNSARITPKLFAEKLFSDPKNILTLQIDLLKPITVEIVAKRVLEIGRRPRQHVGPERWFICERLKDGAFKYYVSNFDSDTKPEEIIKLAHQRWKVEQGYQQLKEEIGLDHFEGRSWLGLHHHIALCFMAFNFLQILARQHRRGKKKSALTTAHS